MFRLLKREGGVVMYGQMETWKIVYNLPPMQQNGGVKGVALIEADRRDTAIFTFQQQYAGQYSTIHSCERLIK